MRVGLPDAPKSALPLPAATATACSSGNAEATASATAEATATAVVRWGLGCRPAHVCAVCARMLAAPWELHLVFFPQIGTRTLGGHCQQHSSASCNFTDPPTHRNPCTSRANQPLVPPYVQATAAAETYATAFANLATCVASASPPPASPGAPPQSPAPAPPPQPKPQPLPEYVPPPSTNPTVSSAQAIVGESAAELL